MTKTRTITPPYNNKGRCRWCNGPMPKGRRRWCSEACVDDFTVRAWPSRARALVKLRDKGVCSECGLDCVALKHHLEGLRTRAQHAEEKSYYRKPMGENHGGYIVQDDRPEATAGRYAARKWLLNEVGWWFRELGFTDKLMAATTWGHLFRNRTSLWDADHIVPVVEDGGGCGLDNYRTLCIPCHKKSTAQLRKRMAQNRDSPNL